MNKLTQSCQSLGTWVGGRLMEAVGIPSSQVWYRRLYINGRYYHYMGEYERVGEELLKRMLGKAHEVGDLFKSVGDLTSPGEGPYGWGDQRDLPPFCGYTREQRFAHTYQRKAPDWKDEAMAGSKEVQDLSAELVAARPGNVANVAMMKAFFEKNFDVPLLLNYVAALNWMFPWDDFFQNHFLYRRTDGKWLILPWDFDLLMGGFTRALPGQAGTPTSANSTFYAGEVGDPGNRDGWINTLKDGFIKAYRTELQAKLRELTAGPLSAQNVGMLVDKARAEFKDAEAQMAPAVAAAFCAGGVPNVKGAADGYATRIKNFARDRNARVTAGLWTHGQMP